jgi:RNA polymerase sigma-70 factor (ECF subfamily)
MAPEAPLHPDSALVAGCLAGHRASQEAFYKRFASKMFGVVLRYAPNRDTAADLLQEGFITAFNRLEQFRHEGSLEGWVRRIMVNTAISYCRKEIRRGTQYDLEDVAYALADTAPTALDGLGAEELLQLVQQLPAGFRAVFSLYAIEGYTHEEIAEALNISIGTSKSQLSRAREALRQKLATLQSVQLEYEPAAAR